MLNCKQVAQLASDYLDRETNASLSWQMRWHLLMCANCRRFVRHLRITKDLTGKIVSGSVATETIDAEAVLEKIKARQQASLGNHSSDKK